MHDPRDIAIVACLIAIARNARPGMTYEDTGEPVDDVRAAYALLDQCRLERDVQHSRLKAQSRREQDHADHH